MPHLEALGFEAFPAEVRLKIYRELLINEDEQDLDPPEMCGNPGSGLHPQILACNKKIHDEAATVLYGENRFTFMFAGNCPIKLWHPIESDKTILPRRYSRLVTKMHVFVSFQGDDNDISWQAVKEGYDQTLANMENLCKKLSVNDLKWLEVNYINSYTGGPHRAAIWGAGRFSGKPYMGENCLLPLMKVRATRVSLPCLATSCQPCLIIRNSSRSTIMALQPSQYD